MEDWVVELQGGRPDAAWDRFLERYRRLIFAAIRHYAQDYDDVMDVFAQGLAHPGEDVHHVVVVLGVVPDRREDQPAVPFEEPVPGGLRPATL